MGQPAVALQTEHPGRTGQFPRDRAQVRAAVLPLDPLVEALRQAVARREWLAAHPHETGS
jgi:hypothetical protein